MISYLNRPPPHFRPSSRSRPAPAPAPASARSPRQRTGRGQEPPAPWPPAYGSARRVAAVAPTAAPRLQNGRSERCSRHPHHFRSPLLAFASRSSARRGSRRAITAAVPPSLLHLSSIRHTPGSASPSAFPDANRLHGSCSGEGQFGRAPPLLPPWPLLAGARGRSSSVVLLPPFFPCHGRLHLADLVRASSATTVACTGRPPCDRTAAPPCAPASSMPSSSGHMLGTIGFASLQGSCWW
jgi:hypothetical protein